MEKKKISKKLYKQREKEIIERFLTIKRCKKCGSPVADGWCCVYCGYGE